VETAEITADHNFGEAHEAMMDIASEDLVPSFTHDHGIADRRVCLHKN
jgi:hypothetical protein